MQKLTMTVTAEMIRHAERGSCKRCVIGRSFAEAGFRDVLVGTTGATIFLERGGECSFVNVELPVIAQRCIAAFDARRPVVPFTWPLELPAEVAVEQPL